jgi:hypothetical protein
MPESELQKVINLLEKSLMVQLASLGVPQQDIARMLGKSKATVNIFLKPIAKKEKS